MKKPDFQFNKLRIILNFERMGATASNVLRLLDFIESRTMGTAYTETILKHFGWSAPTLTYVVKRANEMLARHKIIRPHGRLKIIKKED